MIFGDARDFAIEAEIEPGLRPPSAVWGQMCLHLGAVQLGDFSDRCCSLYSSYLGLKHVASQSVRLWDKAFDKLSPGQIHDLVRQSIYGEEATMVSSNRFMPFDFLTNWGEQFDGFSSVICSPSSETVMILHRPYASVGSLRRLAGDLIEVHCTRSGFNAAVLQFNAWFEVQAERLSKKG